MEVPVSLYLKTKQGEHPDLKVAARAAITFAEIIEEITRAIDPDLTVRVEIVSGSEGSLGLNTLNKIYVSAKAKADNVRQGVLEGWRKHERARWLAVFVAVSILDNTISWGYQELVDWLKSEDAPAEVYKMSEEELRAFAVQVVSEMRREQTSEKVQKLYNQISRDETIEAIGVTAQPGPARRLLSRSQFAEKEPVTDETDRTTRSLLEVTLVSPVLEFGDRRWRLRGPNGEFGAPIKDKDFLRSTVAGETNLHLRGGVILNIELETQERFIDGAWETQSYSVEKVHGWREGPVQEDLLSPSA